MALAVKMLAKKGRHSYDRERTSLKELKEYMDWSDRGLQEMQKESKRVGELNKTLEQNQKLRTQWTMGAGAERR